MEKSLKKADGIYECPRTSAVSIDLIFEYFFAPCQIAFLRKRNKKIDFGKILKFNKLKQSKRSVSTPHLTTKKKRKRFQFDCTKNYKNLFFVSSKYMKTKQEINPKKIFFLCIQNHSFNCTTFDWCLDVMHFNFFFASNDKQPNEFKTKIFFQTKWNIG